MNRARICRASGDPGLQNGLEIAACPDGRQASRRFRPFSQPEIIKIAPVYEDTSLGISRAISAGKASKWPITASGPSWSTVVSV